MIICWWLMEAVNWVVHEQSIAHKYWLSGALFVEIWFLPFKRSRKRVRAETISVVLLFSPRSKKTQTNSELPNYNEINDPESYIKLLSVVIVHHNKIVVLQRNDKTSYPHLSGYHYWGISETWFISFFMGQIQSLSLLHTSFPSEINRKFCLKHTKRFLSV